MPRKEWPRFVIYQPNQREFHFCLEVSDKFIRWSSYYPPTLDTRYQREVTRIEDLPKKKLPRKAIFDQGTYTITQSDTKETVGKKIQEAIKKKSVSFVLNGKKLKGRFILKQLKTGTVLQKHKDKYAVEEDVLSGDLSRTISTMIPDYDEKKVILNTPRKAKRTIARQPEPEPTEEITADKKIGNTEYHFAYYTSDNEPDICLITSTNSEVFVLKKEKKQWVLQPIPNRSILKKEKEFTGHAKALYGT